MNYDYIIIGAGPSGLTLAYYLSNLGKKCLLVDKNKSIGGCHRVIRSKNNLFSEHAPRVYSDAYVNFIKLLKDMNVNFKDLFVPFYFDIQNIIHESINIFTLYEIFLFTIEFIRLFIDENYSRHKTVFEFMKYNNFTDKTISYVNKICRMTDRVDSKKYTLYNFLQLISVSILYKLYQPKLPHDVNLFKIWLDKLKNVDILLDTEVKKINYENNKIINIEINNKIYTANDFILAIPPLDINKLLKNSLIQDSFFKNPEIFDKWSKFNSYDTTLSIVFHYNYDLKLQKKNIIPNTEWGIFQIVLSDYMDFQNKNSITVITTMISILDKKSSKTNKTANETTNKNDLIIEVLRQINLPLPTKIIIDDDIKNINNKWVGDGTAFIQTTDINTHIPFESIRFNNLYNVGTQNGNNTFPTTSMETAITSSLYLLHKLEPSTKSTIKIYETVNLVHIIKFILVFLFMYYLLFHVIKIDKKKLHF